MEHYTSITNGAKYSDIRPTGLVALPYRPITLLSDRPSVRASSCLVTVVAFARLSVALLTFALLSRSLLAPKLLRSRPLKRGTAFKRPIHSNNYLWANKAPNFELIAIIRNQVPCIVDGTQVFWCHQNQEHCNNTTLEHKIRHSEAFLEHYPKY